MRSGSEKKKKKPKHSSFWAGYSWDIRHPDVGISRTKTLSNWPFSVVLDTEWPGCPGIWVGTSRIWKNFICIRKLRADFSYHIKERGRKAHPLPRSSFPLFETQAWWTFRIFFLFFFCSGAGEKEEASEEVAGGSVLIKNRGRGGGFRGGGVGGGRALGKCLWGGGV